MPVLGALFLIFFLLLSCDDVESDDDDNSSPSSPTAPSSGDNVFAGNGNAGFRDGQGTGAQLSGPYGIAVASSGTVYVADYGNHRIRKITATGLVSTFAGTGAIGSLDGQKTTVAQFSYPQGVAIGPNGDLYVADSFNSRIRKITLAGEVTTVAGSTNGFQNGQGTAAQFASPKEIAIASDGTIYVADTSNSRIRKITSDGTVTTFAGGSTRGFQDGQGTAAQFASPQGIAIASDGTIYVADSNNHRIRKITSAGLVSTVAGGATAGIQDGQGTVAKFNEPAGVAVASDGTIYVADTNNNQIRKITSGGTVTTILKGLKFPRGIGLSPDGSTAYVADTSNNRILKLNNPNLLPALTP